MKEQGIIWKNTEGEFQYYDDEFEKWMSRISKIVLDVICALFFVAAGRVMLNDVYYWASFDFEDLIELFVLGIIISAVVDLVNPEKLKDKLIVRGAVLGAALLFSFGSLFIWGNWQQISQDLEKLYTLYINDAVIEIPDNYNAMLIYYSMEQYSIAPYILNLVTMILFLILFALAKTLRKNHIMLAFPILCLVLEIIRGYTPDYDGFLFMIVGIVLSKVYNISKVHFTLAPGRKYINVGSLRFFWWAILAICVILVGNIVKFGGTPVAKGLLKYSDSVVRVCDQIVNNITDTMGTFDEERDYERVRIDNTTPKYEHIEVLSYSMNSMPVGNIYLKGYSANTYSNGVWKNDVQGLKKLWAEKGLEYQSVCENVFEMNAKKIYASMEDVKNLKNSKVSNSIKIEYFIDVGEKVHLPYFIEIYDSAIFTEDDIRYKKDEDEMRVSVVGWQHESIWMNKTKFYHVANTESWDYAYLQYILEEYTKVPDDMKNVKKIANEIEAIYEKKYNTGEKTTEMDNYKRIRLAAEVAGWLSKNTEYSLNLSKLPFGEDPIEYFLGESKKGYCMHYASAAALILREMGVPARYASGYIVYKDDFERNLKEFVSYVPDDNAHAWVEIFMDGIGWVPYEMTKGYDEYLIDYGDNNGGENIGGSSGNDNNGDADNKTDIEDSTDKKEEKQNNKKKINIKLIAIVCIVIVSVVLILAVIILLINNYSNRFSKKLEREREKENALTVIKMINGRMYNKLLLSGKIRKLAIRDDEYREALIYNYCEIPESDWDRYMEIVKAAAFSKREFTVEEMEFCIDIYLKVSIKPKKNMES